MKTLSLSKIGIVGIVLLASSPAFSANFVMTPKARLNMRNFVEADAMVSEANGYFKNKGMTFLHTKDSYQYVSQENPDRLMVIHKRKYSDLNDKSGPGQVFGKSMDLYEIDEIDGVAVRALKKKELSVEREVANSNNSSSPPGWKITVETRRTRSGKDTKNGLWISYIEQDPKTLSWKSGDFFNYELDSRFGPDATIIGCTVKPAARGVGVDRFSVQVLEGNKVTEVTYKIEDRQFVYVGKRPMNLAQFFAGDIKPRETVRSSSPVRGMSVDSNAK